MSSAGFTNVDALFDTNVGSVPLALTSFLFHFSLPSHAITRTRKNAFQNAKAWNLWRPVLLNILNTPKFSPVNVNSSGCATSTTCISGDQPTNRARLVMKCQVVHCETVPHAIGLCGQFVTVEILAQGIATHAVLRLTLLYTDNNHSIVLYNRTLTAWKS